MYGSHSLVHKPNILSNNLPEQELCCFTCVESALHISKHAAFVFDVLSKISGYMLCCAPPSLIIVHAPLRLLLLADCSPAYRRMVGLLLYQPLSSSLSTICPCLLSLGLFARASWFHLATQTLLRAHFNWCNWQCPCNLNENGRALF